MTFRIDSGIRVKRVSAKDRKDRNMKDAKISKFATSIAYILIGVVLIMWPNKVEDVICSVLAACVVVVGLAKLIGYSVTKVESRISNDTNGFAIGISLVILGIFLWLKGTIIIAIIPFLLGLMITYKGLEGVQNVLNFKKFGYGVNKGVLIVSLVITAFGVLVMMNPFSTANFLFMMLGIGLLVSGLADLISDIIFSRQIRNEPGAPGNKNSKS